MATNTGHAEKLRAMVMARAMANEPSYEFHVSVREVMQLLGKGDGNATRDIRRLKDWGYVTLEPKAKTSGQDDVYHGVFYPNGVPEPEVTADYSGDPWAPGAPVNGCIVSGWEMLEAQLEGNIRTAYPLPDKLHRRLKKLMKQVEALAERDNKECQTAYVR